MFVKLLDERDLSENAEAFKLIDVDHSGTIEVSECLEKIRSINRSGKFKEHIDEEDVECFVNKVDIDNSGKISYSQFLCATLTENHFSETNVKNLFDDIDQPKRGYLNKYSLLRVFKCNARDVKIEDVEEMMD